jgi:hypothetical protein
LHRFLSLALLLAALAVGRPALGASCAARMADCPDGPNTRAEVAPLGLHANAVIDASGALVSGTSDDVTLAALVAKCSAGGGRLKLPAGKILLTGAGGTSIPMTNCHLEGTGVPGGTATNGTTFILTSLAVPPFICGQDWAWSGINFYWPGNTTGVVHYPPLMTDSGSAACGNAYLDKVVIANPYDGFVHNTSESWANFIISNSIMYATHDLFALKKTGGSWVLNNILAGPGPWFSICPGCKATGGTAASANSSFFHPLDVSNGQGMTVSVANVNTFNWGHFILMDSGSSVGNSVFNVNLDGMANIIDASAGGNYAPQNTMTGFNVGCGGFNWDSGEPVATGNKPCFDMGARSSLVLSGFNGGTSRGDMIRLSGGNVFIDGGGFGGIGQAADGGDYYMIHLTANSPNTQIKIKDTNMTGRNADAKVHGIVAANAFSRLIVDNSTFGFFNEVISAPYASHTIIKGNDSISTTGPVSVILTSPGSVSWVANQFDKPPLATIEANCGPGALVKGTLRGTISMGSGTVMACTLHLPLTPFTPDGNGACTFSNTTSFITAGSIGDPPTWNMASTGNIAGEQTNFSCGSE